MTTTWTMAEARRRFRELLDRAARGEPVRISRRGQIAAVVIGPRDFERLERDLGGFADAVRRFRASVDANELLDDDLEGLRDRTPARPVRL